jgi:two-component system response regulator HydG
MANYTWPGNVRELRNAVESMVVQDTDGILNLDDLQEGDALRQTVSVDAKPAAGSSLVGRTLSEIERHYIERTLEMTQGNREEAARILGIGERTLYRDIQDWKLQDKIRGALDQANGNLEEAAKLLGCSTSVLQRKMKKLGL